MSSVERKTEERLIRGLETRDEGAVAHLLGRCWTPAYHLAYRALGDAGLAEDAAQEAFLTALSTIERLQDGRPLRP